MKILEVSPDEFGFRQYAVDLVLAGRELPADDRLESQFLNPIFYPQQRTSGDIQALVRRIAEQNPDLVHVQHEFGFMGSKVPGRYRFPRLVKELRRALPQAKLVATAHSVIGTDFRYPVHGRGWQVPFRLMANALLLPLLRRLWIQKSWGALDGVIVHSRLQVPAVEASGCAKAAWIPHYVPNRYEKEPEKKLAALESIGSEIPILFVFGYFTPEKGQDVMIRAMKKVSTKCHLVLAGGVRREEDRSYFEHCKKLIETLELKSQISITGFLSWPELDDLCRRATLAVLPFRETSGSGSLADLMSRGAPVLASDLPLNREIQQSISEAMVCFKSDDPEDCAIQIDGLLKNPQALERLRSGARVYREKFSPENVIRNHLLFFREVVAQAK